MFAGLTDRTWIWLAAGCYVAAFLLGTIALWRASRQTTARINFAIALGYAFQVIGLYVRGRADGGCPLGNTFEIFQFTAWSATTLYFLVGVTFRSSLLGYFSSCLAAVLTTTSLAIPAWDATRRTKIFGGNPWIELHASLAVLSYGVFGLLALTALLLLLRHRSLKSKNLGGWFSFLPPILDLDHISVRLLTTGVAVLTASLLGGAAYWIRDTSTVNGLKLSLTLLVWAAYALALGLRLKGRLLATRFAWTCVVLFGAALISLAAVDSSRHPGAVPPPSAVAR